MYGHTRNPVSPEALTLNDVKPGVPFSVVGEDGEEVKSGTFLERPGYDENEGCYIPVKAELEPDGKEGLVGVYDSGIICHPNGDWSGSFTVRKAFGQ
ncbi:MAG TPA: hypothetical protein VFK11_02010 [Candidatus Saccharimonadales bacterium]|nr:hypothetical protein [Candidatus Saccharimonadales bacterium]